MGQIPFIGRQKELKILQELLDKRVASLVVLKGRRRIGKSRLAHEFGKGMKTVIITGLPPSPGVGAQSQRRAFAEQISLALGIPRPRADDWTELFWHLAYHTKRGRVMIVLDEITWLGSKDPTFMGKLKSAWDLHFSKNSKLILMLTGSISSWIEKNILSHTGFVGRVSLDMTLEELPLYRCNEFWVGASDHLSAFEKLKVLSVTGGVPRYLEEINPKLSAEENISKLCFRREGLLFNEFQHIFDALFQRRSDTYQRVVETLVDGGAELKELVKSLKIKKGGTLSSYLHDLELSGFLARDYTWQLQNGVESKLSRFRLKDNYLRFYLKYIAPNRKKIEQGRFSFENIEWKTIIGLQFENLVLNNRDMLLKVIGLDAAKIVCDNPYFQNQTATRKGCQIDYLIQTRYRTLYLFEIKFSQHPISLSVIDQIQQKMDRLNAPQSFSIRPVLVHVNGVTNDLIESDFFSHIINFGQLLQ